MASNQINLANYMATLRDCAIGPYEPISKAAAVCDGMANRMARVMGYRNERPSEAREQLRAAFATWPVLCRVMAELEEAYPEDAGIGSARARPMIDALDRRDRRGDYA